MDAAAVSRLQKTLLQHPQVGPRLKALAQRAVPGKAKFADLTKEQQRWIFNALKNKSLKEHYHLEEGSGNIVVKSALGLLAVLGDEQAAASSVVDQAVVAAEAPAPKASPAPEESRASAPRKRKMTASTSRKKRAQPALGKRCSAAADLARRVLHHGRQQRGLVSKLLKKLVARVDTTFPGMKQELLRDEPVVDNVIVRTLGKLREEATQRGFQSIAIADLDFVMSNERTWPRSFLQKHGYCIGRRAWRTLQGERFQGGATAESRRLWERSRQGGAPSKVSAATLAVTRAVLERNSKPGSKVASVHQNADGSFGRARPRGDQADERVVPGQSLLATPARMWSENEELQSLFSRTSFYKVLKKHFADFREGHRDTDVCSHCQCYWRHLVPRFHQDWATVHNDLKSVYPNYFDHFNPSNFADCGEEADAACKYINSHCARYREERERSGCDRLQLHTFTEAPALVLLRGHRSLLRSYLWHMLSARRQQECLKKLMTPEGLPLEDSLLVFDWREKIRLPVGPQETGDMWHAQQKYAISCFGCCVFQWEQLPGDEAKMRQTYLMLISEIREQTAEASNLMLEQVLAMANVSRAGCLHFFSDCGPHFRSAESLHHRVMQVCFQRKQTVRVNFLGEQHGKSLLDGAFGTTGMHGWLGRYALKKPIHSLDHLLTAFKAGADEAMALDPEGPRWLCEKVDFGTHRASEVGLFVSTGFKITRTYCMMALKPASRAKKPVVHNLVFSDIAIPAEGAMSYQIQMHTREEPLEWKRSYLEGEKTWELEPPNPGDTTQLCRKHESQKARPPPDGLRPVKTFHERVQSKARRAARDKALVEDRMLSLASAEGKLEAAAQRLGIALQRVLLGSLAMPAQVAVGCCQLELGAFSEAARSFGRCCWLLEALAPFNSYHARWALDAFCAASLGKLPTAESYGAYARKVLLAHCGSAPAAELMARRRGLQLPKAEESEAPLPGEPEVTCELLEDAVELCLKATEPLELRALEIAVSGCLLDLRGAGGGVGGRLLLPLPAHVGEAKVRLAKDRRSLRAKFPRDEKGEKRCVSRARHSEG
ncbi:unnamed protein product [Effrenium voratum]|uniref:Uncharacterized protein n=1 Tax=Effrenium voratum TaxID=2562239 RepID=A0AA36I2M9_9DINO|nr:unnamed protein product [Effrenium voratum]